MSDKSLEIRNYFLKKFEIHPLTEFNEEYFLDLLRYSLSLGVNEKKRIINSISILSQNQIDKLTKVFVNEKEEFKKLVDKPNELEEIKRLHKKAKTEWDILYQQFLDLEKQEEVNKSEEKKIEDIKKWLWI